MSCNDEYLINHQRSLLYIVAIVKQEWDQQGCPKK